MAGQQKLTAPTLFSIACPPDLQGKNGSGLLLCCATAFAATTPASSSPASRSSSSSFAAPSHSSFMPHRRPSWSLGPTLRSERRWRRSGRLGPDEEKYRLGAASPRRASQRRGTCRALSRPLRRRREGAQMLGKQTGEKSSTGKKRFKGLREERREREAKVKELEHSLLAAARRKERQAYPGPPSRWHHHEDL